MIARTSSAIARVIMDKVLLRLEGAISLDEFKKEIVCLILESRDKFKSGLFGAPQLPFSSRSPLTASAGFSWKTPQQCSGALVGSAFILARKVIGDSGVI